ncbi:MAG TPA: hypothetical protein VFE62_18600 [Gemmataceae bacterium]|nr:hypothetical protein [Gemmataceae bacterium]
MQRFVAVALLLIGMMVLPASSSSQDDPKKDKKAANAWMKAKVGFSREILIGLTEGDFKKIKLNATALNATHFFEAIFTTKSDEYRQQAAAFAMANNELVRQAEAKNIYGATLAYNQLTVSCVQCHVIVRNGKK